MTPRARYLYWLAEEDFLWASRFLREQGFEVAPAVLTACQVLRASEKRVVYAPPDVWTRMCNRQSSWYRESHRKGQTMMMSAKKLPAEMERFLDAELAPTDFQPERLPGRDELQRLIDSNAYQSRKPAEWEDVSWLDALGLKLLFSVTRFWRRGDNMKRHWLGHRANHANFLARRFVTDLDGEEVPYSVTDNDGVCSSCAEFFNVVAPDSRKLVRACPGAVIFAGAERHVYLDVKPVRIVV
jgi:hypothetical protein